MGYGHSCRQLALVLLTPQKDTQRVSLAVEWFPKKVGNTRSTRRDSRPSSGQLFCDNYTQSR